MHERTKRLRELRKEHDLTGMSISIMLSVEHNTVMRWLMPEADRVIPDAMLKLLERLIKKGRMVVPQTKVEPHERTVRLRELKEKHNLTAPMIGNILGRSKQTATTWLMLDTQRVIPENCLKVLEYELNKIN